MRSFAVIAAFAAICVMAISAEPSRPRPQQVPPRPPHPRLRRDAAPEDEVELLEFDFDPKDLHFDHTRIAREAEAMADPARPRPQQVPPRPPHPRLRREAEPARPRPQQVPPRPPHPRLRREAEPARPRPQQVPPRPPHPRLRREAEPARPRPQQVPPRPPHPRLRREVEAQDDFVQPSGTHESLSPPSTTPFRPPRPLISLTEDRYLEINGLKKKQ